MSVATSVQQFVGNQRSIHLYPQVQESLTRVLLAMPAATYETATKELVLMVLHEGAFGQVMHFNRRGAFPVMQLDVPNEVPDTVLDSVIAHEFGHVLQGRNWSEEVGDALEDDATSAAASWGFHSTLDIQSWLKAHRVRRGDTLH